MGNDGWAILAYVWLIFLLAVAVWYDTPKDGRQVPWRRLMLWMCGLASASLVVVFVIVKMGGAE